MKSMLCVLGGSILVVGLATGVNVTAERAAGATPTFNTDVAPIIFNNCVTCHRPDQVAPMSLMSYNEVRPWARAIKDKVTKRVMPPWHADPRYGEFRNDRRLTDEQIKTIVAWADGGAPQGDAPLTVQPPAVQEGWTHPSGRPPDMVIAMKIPFDVPAEGELPNFTLYEEIPEELKREDRFVEAIQILPEQKASVHHASFGIAPLPPNSKLGVGELWPGGPVRDGALVDPKTGKRTGRVVNDGNGGDANKAAAAEGRSGSLRFCCYVPGTSFRQFREGSGARIPKDGAISWGLHYTPIGRPVADRMKVGLWFQRDLRYEITENTRGGEKHIVLGKELVDDEFTPLRLKGVANSGFPALPVIPPHTRNWAITEIRMFQDDATLYGMWVHMHTRGKEMTYVLTHPDGREQVLLSVPNYDFNWQTFYELKQPIKIAAGSTLKLVGSYDNSVANRNVSSPHKEVYWSEQSWDEMYIGFTQLSIDKDDLRLTKRPVPTTAGQQQ